MDIEKLLQDFKKNKISKAALLKKLKNLPYEDLGDVKLDHHRKIRRGFSEVIYCENKTMQQVSKILHATQDNKTNILLTRLKKEYFIKLNYKYKRLQYNEKARAAYIINEKTKQKPGILIISAGTSDIPVAEEAVITAALMGNKVEKLYDVGVAGLHRVLNHKKQLEKAKVIVVIAGMEGALAGIVSGLTSAPVIACPTSVGYGANFKGITTLLAMMNACSPGIAVVNIDNGFGAGYMAALINKR